MSSYECIVVMNRRGECEHVHYIVIYLGLGYICLVFLHYLRLTFLVSLF